MKPIRKRIRKPDAAWRRLAPSQHLSGRLRFPYLPLLLITLAGFVALQSMSTASANANATGVLLECPMTDVLEGESLDVFLVRADDATDVESLGASWRVIAATAAASDFSSFQSNFEWSTDPETGEYRMAGSIATSQDDLAEGDETFTVGYALGNDADAELIETCVVTIKDDDPHVTELRIASTPAVGDTYGLNEEIEIEAVFNTPVTVRGRAHLAMWIGTRWYAAWYQSGSGTDTLTFSRQVLWEDFDDDGITISRGRAPSASAERGFGGSGSILALGTNVEANRFYAGIKDASDHKVDWNQVVRITDVSVISSPEDGEAYRAGESLEVQLTYEEAMVVEGAKGVSIYVGDDDDAWRGARYNRGSGTDTLVFSYTVKRTDFDTDGFSVSAGSKGSGYFGSGSIRSQATGQHSSVRYRAIHDIDGHEVVGSTDLVAPKISSLSVTSEPSERDYVDGDEITVEVEFDENVIVSGSAQLELDFDGSPRVATLRASAEQRGSGEDEPPGSQSLTFVYTVVEGDHDPDGFAIGQNKLSLSDGAIEDAAGNTAILDHDAVPANPVQCVDARNHPPTFNEGDNAARTVDESPSAGALVGEPVVATDPEGQELTYSLSGEDASTFAINSASGQLRTTERLSFEYRNTYSVWLTASDGESDAHLDLTIHVTDIDEPGRVNVWRPTPLCTPVLHALLSDPDGRKTDVTWLWEISDNGEDHWSTIGEIASHESSYSPLAADANKFLRITVTYADKFGSGKSVQRIESIGPVEPLQDGCLAEATGTLIR